MILLPKPDMYPTGSDIYDMKYQMSAEECGNMLEFEIHLDFIAKLAYNSIKSRFTKSRFEQKEMAICL